MGNYLALQTSADFYHLWLYPDSEYRHTVTGVAALWGAQRRLGEWGVFDLNAGPRLFAYPRYNAINARLQVGAEINISIGLAH